jgi:exodeoxyribonuclease VII large subunit
MSANPHDDVVPTAKILSVTQLLRRIKNVIEIDVGEVWVEGEVSNLKKQGSGHWYFTLKDDNAQIQCAMFGARKREGHQALQDGAKVKVFAEATIYEQRGNLQIIVLRAEAAGLGDLQARYEALKRKLQEEGLFEQSRKQALPRFPRTIGIVTSETGAVIQDIMNVIGRRAPWVRPVLIPVRVQGKGSEREIATAIRVFSEPERFSVPRCDLLIVGRGGGSLEDLWSFNEEIVARAIADCPIPLISAVGHEIDFTIADFVADLRAPTPSAAAEIAVPDGEELSSRLQALRRRLQQNTYAKLNHLQVLLDSMRRGPLQRNCARLLREPIMRVDALRDRLEFTSQRNLQKRIEHLQRLKTLHRALHPLLIFQRKQDHCQNLRQRLQQIVTQKVQSQQQHLTHLDSLLRTLGPESSLQRGYSITFDENGNVIRSQKDVSPGKKLITRVSDGEIHSFVE